jgi:hypothetical protein
MPLFRFPKLENMSEKFPPRLRPTSVDSILGGVAVLARLLAVNVRDLLDGVASKSLEFL